MKNIMVCVTLQNTCEKLIEYAQTIKQDDDSLFVLHVAKNGEIPLNEKAKTLEFLYSVSHKAGADMTVLYSDSSLNTILQFIREKNINIVILGIPENNYKNNSFISQLEKNLPSEINIILIDKEKGVIHRESIFNSNWT